MNQSLDELLSRPPEAPPITYLGRSTLERWATCPYQAWSCECDGVQDTSEDAAVGIEVHRILAEAVGAYRTQGWAPKDYLEAELPKARPDIQPQVLAAARPSIWAVQNMLSAHNPADILAHQGGDGEFSGQYHREILPATPTTPAVHATSQVDLLMAGPSMCELYEVDWKSGHRLFRATDVKASFQFRFHAWLLFHAYPELETLFICVWMTRFNTATPWVRWTRTQAEEFSGRVSEAVEYRRRALIAAQDDPGRIETWPLPAKCALCPVAFRCPRAMLPSQDIEADPASFAEDTLLMEAALRQRRESLRSYVDKAGAIALEDGRWYGLKPKTPRKPTLTQYGEYRLATEESDDD